MGSPFGHSRRAGTIVRVGLLLFSVVASSSPPPCRRGNIPTGRRASPERQSHIPCRDPRPPRRRGRLACRRPNPRHTVVFRRAADERHRHRCRRAGGADARAAQRQRRARARDLHLQPAPGHPAHQDRDRRRRRHPDRERRGRRRYHQGRRDHRARAACDQRGAGGPASAPRRSRTRRGRHARNRDPRHPVVLRRGLHRAHLSRVPDGLQPGQPRGPGAGALRAAGRTPLRQGRRRRPRSPWPRRAGRAPLDPGRTRRWAGAARRHPGLPQLPDQVGRPGRHQQRADRGRAHPLLGCRPGGSAVRCRRQARPAGQRHLVLHRRKRAGAGPGLRDRRGPDQRGERPGTGQG